MALFLSSRNVRHGGASLVPSPVLAGIAAGVTAAVIWATYLVAAKSGTAIGLLPQDFVLLRFGTAALVMLPWLLRNDPRTLGGVGWRRAIILALLASEILAVTGSTPSQRYGALAEKYGAPTYARIDAPADREQKARLAKLSPEQVSATELAGEEITAKLTTAPGNGAPLGGLKVTTANAWFAARPSGTEDVYKIYAESFLGAEHLAEVQDAARDVVNSVIR